MTRRHRLELSAGLGLVAIALGAAVFSSAGRSGSAGKPPAFDVSRAALPAPAPELDAVDLGGRRLTLRDFQGRVVLVNFWATWCVPCRDEMPAMETLARELGPRGLTVLAVNYKESRPLVADFVQTYRVTFPVLLDPDGRIAERYRVYGLPATFFVDRQGAVVATVLGFRDWAGAGARAYLAALLAPGA